MIFCAHGRPREQCAQCKPPEPARPIVHGLPSWFGGLKYDADRNLATVTIGIPVRGPFGELAQQPIAFETKIAELEVLAEQLARVVARAKEVANVVDAKADEKKPPGDVIDVD